MIRNDLRRPTPCSSRCPGDSEKPLVPRRRSAPPGIGAPGQSLLRTVAAVLALVLLVGLGTPTLAAPSLKSEAKALPTKYQDWLKEVEVLISRKESKEFLGLEKDYQRDAFIERFWEARDPYPDSSRNEFRDEWEARKEYALETWGKLYTDQPRMLLLNGEPTGVRKVECPKVSWPLELWQYVGNKRLRTETHLVFYQEGQVGDFRLWTPNHGIEALFREPLSIYATACPGIPEGQLFHTEPASLDDPATLCFLRMLAADCDLYLDDPRAILDGIRRVAWEGPIGYQAVEGKLNARPDPREGEWLANFAAYSTDLPEGVEALSAEVEIAYPGKDSFRTVVQTVVTVPKDAAEAVDLAGRRSYNFQITGEMLRDEKLFEGFRYKFDQPADEVGEVIPLVFQRYLRPATYKLVFKLEDLNAGSYFRHEETLEVPEVDPDADRPPLDARTAQILEEADQALLPQVTDLRLTAPEDEVHTGMTRFQARPQGDEIRKVTFFLNGRPLLSKKRPPYSVELDLGKVPRKHRVRAEGYDETGERVASDELELNTGKQRFAVRLIEPRRDRTYRQSLRAKAEVQTPRGVSAERVEFYLNETLVATHYQMPYVQPIVLGGGASGEEEPPLVYVRAVAFLPDGNSTEDVVFVNAPDHIEELDIQVVELYTSILDGAGRPVEGLTMEDFRVREDEVEQSIWRFDLVQNLPIHAGILLDTSASMEENLRQTRDAALSFLERLEPKDRATLVTFNDRPHLSVEFTNEIETLAGGLAGLKAERGTALWDSLIFTLYYFNGVQGQRAVLLLSDGKDESSRHTYEETLDYARTAGVTLYTIGLDLPRSQLDTRRKLTRLAEETGGRSFFIATAQELAEVYNRVESELRSRYLLAYQSSGGGGGSGPGAFRVVEVTIPGHDYTIQTLKGYYP